VQSKDWLLYVFVVALLLAWAHQRAKANSYAAVLRLLAARDGLPPWAYLPEENRNRFLLK